VELRGRLRWTTITAAVPPFNAKVVFRFEAESVEAAGRELRRLARAAAAVGFELEQGRVEPRPADPEDGQDCTGYAPLDEPSP
jgi:predicted TIM-barrel fold metal-dependent hydrolase